MDAPQMLLTTRFVSRMTPPERKSEMRHARLEPGTHFLADLPSQTVAGLCEAFCPKYRWQNSKASKLCYHSRQHALVELQFLQNAHNFIITGPIISRMTYNIGGVVPAG